MKSIEPSIFMRLFFPTLKSIFASNDIPASLFIHVSLKFMGARPASFISGLLCPSFIAKRSPSPFDPVCGYASDPVDKITLCAFIFLLLLIVIVNVLS